MNDPIKVISLDATARTDTAACTEVDLGPYNVVGRKQVKCCWFPVVTGADTDETYDFKIQESADTVSTNFGDITGAAFTQVLQDATLAMQEITFVPYKRYIRGYYTAAGTTPGMTVCAAVSLGGRFDT